MKPDGAVRLRVQPITWALAREYVDRVHRHHDGHPMVTGFAVAAVDPDDVVRGVAMAGIPNAANRLRDGLRTLEVLRVATDGCPNACSVLYAACTRAAKALGYSRVISYVLDTETGTSILAAGWKQDRSPRGTYGSFGNMTWANRPGRTGANFGPKGRWSFDIHGTDRPPLRFPDWYERERQISSQTTLFALEDYAA